MEGVLSVMPNGGRQALLPLLESLLWASGALAYARFAADGALLHANPRFLDLIGGDAGGRLLPDLVVEGQRDEMVRLLRGGERRVAAPPLRGRRRRPTTLLVTWARDGDELLLLGEPPVADLEAAQATLVKLNSRVSELARENAKKSAQLRARARRPAPDAEPCWSIARRWRRSGQMTAGVAHELNNPLAYVKNNQYLLRRGVDDLLALVNLLRRGSRRHRGVAARACSRRIMDRIEDIDLPRLGERMPELLESVDEGIERVPSGLVQGLRTFSRLDEADVKTIDLNESLRSVVEFAGFLLKENDTEFAARVRRSAAGDLLARPAQPGGHEHPHERRPGRAPPAAGSGSPPRSTATKC